MFKGSISAGLGSLTNVGFEGHSDIEACCSWAADIGHSDGGSGSFCGKCKKGLWQHERVVEINLSYQRLGLVLGDNNCGILSICFQGSN